MKRAKSLTGYFASHSAIALLLACNGTGPSAEHSEDLDGASSQLDVNQTFEQRGVTATSAPDQCASARLTRRYNLGVTRGERLVLRTWRRFASCDKVEAFADSVMSQIDKELADIDEGEDLPARRCRQIGVADGMFAELDLIQQRCSERCFMRGDYVGAVEAIAYCNLIIDAGGSLDPEPWIRSPVSVCGLEFEVACDAQFLGKTASYANAFGTCAPYTQSPYLDIWDRSRLKSCDYNRHTDGS